MLRKWGILGLTVIVSIMLAVMASTPLSPKGLDTPTDHFSSARAMEDVRIIAAAPHPTGSDENAKVRDYLAKRLTVLGMDVRISESKLDERSLMRLNKWSGETKTEQPIYNVIGVLPGADRSKPAILLMAHHDTVWESPGAADDTVGIASILEIVRVLNTAGPQQRDVIALFTDGEELGLVGAKNFFQAHPLRDKIGAVINFEARGGGGTASMFQTSAENGAAARLYARAVKQPSTSSLSTFVYNVLPNDTDLTPALKKDYVAYNIANIGQAKYYHSPKITPDALHEGTLQQMGSAGLDLTQALLAANDLPENQRDATFFDAFGLFTVVYAPFWGWIFLIGAAVFYVFSANLKTSRKDILSGAIRIVGFFLIGGGLLHGLNYLSGNNSGENYYDRLADIPALEILALLVCVSVFFAFFGGKRSSANKRLGAAIPIFVMGVVGQALAPTAAYFITLPLLMCGAATFLMARWENNKASVAMAAVLTALVFGYMLGLEHLLILGVGADMLAVAILPAAIAVLAVLPLFAGVDNRTGKVCVVTGLVLATTLALWLRFDPIASTIPLYSL